ncbi:MAG TPA: 4Fe-4S dicluster-binding protein [Desulfosporosinus sp.]|nr:4Fe-4S dicluster-binding protein [Desulfosporosinus sp.]
MKDLRVQVGPLELKNPVVAGGGPLAGTAQHIIDCVDAGFGAIVTKTTSTPWFLKRYPRPYYRLLDYKKDSTDPYYVPENYTWMHREHNSVYPPLNFAKIIRQTSDYARKNNCAIIGSFSARGLEEWERIARAYEEAGCAALEINFCCPFPPEGLVKSPEEAHVGIYFTRNPEEGAKVLKHLRKIVKIPLFVKLSPDGGSFEQIGKIFQEAGADGLTLFANNKIMRVDIETGRPFVYGPAPGTGPWVKAFSLRWVAEVAAHTGLPVMGNRGASTWQDAVEFIMAGSAAVQYCTPIMLRGLGYVKELLNGIEGFMERRKYDRIADFTGIALKHVYSNQDLIDKVKPLYAQVDLHKCIGCRRCLDVCWYDALHVARKAIIKKENCAGCSICSQVCPVSAIEMQERDNDLDHFRALASAHPDLVEKDFFSKEEYK